MQYVTLGKSDLKVSRLALGCMSYGDPRKGTLPWVLEEEEARPFILHALERGINYFDTANMYSEGASERILGRAIRDYTSRDKVVVATKVFFPVENEPDSKGLSRKAIMSAIEGSLKRLGTDYVDLYQIHRWDYETPIEETLEALHDVVKSGKARYIGASSMHAWQFGKALFLAERNGWTRFVTMQNHYNLLYREEEREMLGLCHDQGVAVVPWSPLARGRLARPWEHGDKTKRERTDPFTKKYYGSTEEADQNIIDRVEKIAARHDAPMSQIALAWLLGKPGIAAPIIGATRLQQIDDAIGALSVKLSEEDVKALEQPYTLHPVTEFV